MVLPSIVPRIKQVVLSNDVIAKNTALVNFLDHPAGPFTVHFWAPAFKWCISLANIADMSKNPDLLSTNQQLAVTLTGLIWSRYSLVITPKNWNLFSVNIFMAGTGLTQLYRKFEWENGGRERAAAAAAAAATPAAE
ncbi:Mitochondrial pyruvate carrier 2 [Aphanomyces cochlioides]|nr:Mitochondrial pyruvate carrier 2 [Aphanomyces cochlioides]